MDVNGRSDAARSQAIRTQHSLDAILDAIASSSPDDAGAELALAKEEIEGLHEGLRTRTVIGQAIGMLMVEKSLTSDEAFAELVELSSQAKAKLRDVATRKVSAADAQASASNERTASAASEAHTVDPTAFLRGRASAARTSAAG
jgi:hypothetical protein